MAGNGVEMARGGASIYTNGLNLENGAQLVGGGLGLTGNLSRACFTEGTQIVVGAEYDENDVFVQYVTVNIEDIKVGDWVYSYDTLTGTVEQKEVTAVFGLESDHINYLTILDEQGREQIIETTDSHPFWVVTDNPDLSRAARSVVDENGVWLYHENVGPTEHGYWIEAKDLREGDVFLGANGELSTLVATERVVFPDGIKVYNFTVDGNHNYFVIAKCDEFGQTCILVHNSDCYTLYQGTGKNGKPYYGITKQDLKVRANQHKNTTGHIIDVEHPILKNLTKRQARAAEQTMINNSGLNNLANIRNSISPKHQKTDFAPDMIEAANRLGGL